MNYKFSCWIKKPGQEWIRVETSLADMGLKSLPVVSDDQIEVAVKKAFDLPDGTMLYNMSVIKTDL